MGKKTVAIIQARMGSSRLPGKVLLPLNRRPAIEQMVMRVCSCESIDEVVVAIPFTRLDGILAAYLCDLFEGFTNTHLRYMCASNRGENDVLGRVYDAALSYKADIIVDLTADCPMVDPACIESIVIAIKKYGKQGIEYISNCETRSWPDGLDVQAYTINALKHAHQWPDSIHEHVGWNIARMLQDRAKLFYPAPTQYEWPELGLTLDEVEDWILLNAIFHKFQTLDGNELFRATDAIDYVRSHPEIITNRSVKRKIPREE